MKSKSRKIIFCGYRSWAIDVFHEIKKNHTSCDFYLAENMKALSDLLYIPEVDLVILAGWSWILKKSVVSNNLVVGLHPSNLPDYAGGSPIQNQIIDGVINSKMTLFKLDKKIDTGEILLKTDLNLSGDMKEIFKSLTESSVLLINKILSEYSEIKSYEQGDGGKKCRRIKPQDSRLTVERIKKMSTVDLYNFIRCREDPYPNVYIEDEEGKLYLKKVKYEAKEK
jgi:methionyl-tRNA formyltransferase